jgi:hypothetical protein
MSTPAAAAGMISIAGRMVPRMGFGAMELPRQAGAAAALLRRALEAKPERSLLPYLIRRPSTLRTIVHIGRMGGFTGSKVTDPRTFDDDGLLVRAASKRRQEVPTKRRFGDAGRGRE